MRRSTKSAYASDKTAATEILGAEDRLQKIALDVQHWSGLGLPDRQIACVLKISEAELYARYGDDINKGKVDANVKVLGVLLEMVASGKYPGLARYWDETRNCSGRSIHDKFGSIIPVLDDDDEYC